MIDNIDEQLLLDERLFLTTVGRACGLTAKVLTNGAFTDVKLSRNSTFGLAFLAKGLKCHDFILCEFRQLHLRLDF